MVHKILLTIHILSVTVWAGVLLYMPRLFIYQIKANSKTEPERSILINQYKLMAKRLWIRVGWPAMILSVIFGMGVMHLYFAHVWFWVKIGFVVALVGYHHMIHFTNKALQNDQYNKSIEQIQSMSNGGMVLIASIIALAVLKTMVNDILIVGGVAVLLVLLYFIIRALIKKSSKKP